MFGQLNHTKPTDDQARSAQTNMWGNKATMRWRIPDPTDLLLNQCHMSACLSDFQNVYQLRQVVGNT
jgi:hypothetical protein